MGETTDNQAVKGINDLLVAQNELIKKIGDDIKKNSESLKVDTKSLEKIVEILKEVKTLIDKSSKDKKSIDSINERIKALKKEREELEKNSQVNADAINKNINEVQKLRNERMKATASMLDFFDKFTAKSKDLLLFSTNLSTLLIADDKRMKDILEKEIKRLGLKSELTSEEKAKLQGYKDELKQLDKIIKAEESRKKQYEGLVKIVDKSAIAMKNIVNNLMKFTSLPSKSKKEEPEKKDESVKKDDNSENKGKDSSGDKEKSTLGDVVSTAEGDSEETAETEEEKTERIKINNEARIESAIGYAEAAKAAVEDLNNIWDAIDESRLNKKQQQYDEDLLSLKDQLANKEITEEEYNEKVMALDKKLSAEKAKIEREQAIRKKATSIFQIAMDTAVAIMKAWTEAPVWGAIPFTVAIAAMGAAQIAAVAAAPIPKARKGGLIVGNSHENGGVLIEAEGGEGILTKEAVRAFPGMVALMNAAAAGGAIQDGGYAARSILGAGGDYLTDIRSGGGMIDYKKLSSAISDNLKEMKIYIAVTDLNDGLKQYVQIENMARL